MPQYASDKDLPETVRDTLPEHAQHIYRDALNSAWERYDEPHDRQGNRDRGETAHAVARNAAKKVYMKNQDGQWVEKSS